MRYSAFHFQPTQQWRLKPMDTDEETYEMLKQNELWEEKKKANKKAKKERQKLKKEEEPKQKAIIVNMEKNDD